MTKNVLGLNINYIDKGEGDLVVLLHGWGANISLFSSMAELLSKKYRVVAMDLPGFGGSDDAASIRFGEQWQAILRSPDYPASRQSA